MFYSILKDIQINVECVSLLGDNIVLITFSSLELKNPSWAWQYHCKITLFPLNLGMLRLLYQKGFCNVYSIPLHAVLGFGVIPENR